MNQFELMIWPPFFFVWGACWGSFLNVVFYRSPLGLSLVYPGSACPACKQPIAFYDNVPVLAWLWLRGKCRRCKNPISVRYPIVEAIFSLLGGLPLLLHPGDLQFRIAASLFLSTFAPSLYMAITYKKVPIWLLIGTLAAAVFYGYQWF